MIRSLLALVLVSNLAACASETASAQPVQRASTDNKDLCVQTMTRARECTDDYIPALVDARAKADVPAGIAAEVAKDRDGVIAQAKEEWKTDSQDANISAMCDKMADQVTASESATAKDCLAKPECKAYTDCVMPLFANHFHK